MAPEKRKIQKARQLSTLRGVNLFVFLPPKTSTDLNANCYRGLNPARRPDPNQQQRRISIKEELVELDKVLEKVSARLHFLQSVSKVNAENSSHQVGDLTSSTPVIGDATAE